MAKITTPDSLYGNSRDILREAERENEILADIAGEEYESPGDIPKGKYVIEKRLLDAAQKKNELLESIAEGSGTISGANKLAIDYGTDVLSLKKGDEPIANSGVTLPAYGVSFDPTTGGLTLTKNGTAVSGQTVTIPNYGSPVGVTSSSDMTDEGTIYLYEGTTGGGFTNGHFYYYDGTAWADGGEYAAATVQTDKTLLVEDRAADAKATGEAVGELKTQLNDITLETYGKNRLNDDALSDGYLGADGSLIISGDWKTTDYCNVKGFSDIVASCTGPNDARIDLSLFFLCTYDEDKTLIEQVWTTGGARAELDENVAFVRFSLHATVINPQLEAGTTRTSYEPYTENFEIIHVKTDSTLTDNTLPANAQAVGLRLSSAENKITSLENTVKIYAPNTVIASTCESGYCDSSGAIVENASCRHTIIVLNDVKNIVYTGAIRFADCYVAVFRDAEGHGISTYLKGTSTAQTYTDEEIPIDANAYDVVITWYSLTASYKVTYDKAANITLSDMRYPWSNKKWVVFGDSLTEENSRTTKHYFDYVSEETGINIYNMGNSGSGYKREDDLGTAFYQRISDVPTDADVITIFGSFNDLGYGAALGTETDNTTDTIAGCMNVTLDNLFTVLPLAIVGIVTPTPWKGANALNAPNTATAYVDMLKKICERRSIPCLNLFENSLLRPWDATFRTLAYSKDEGNGTHPDETGHKIIAPRFKEFLESLLI